MDKLLAQITALWTMRPVREQILLSVGIVLIVLVAFEMLVYKPLRTHHNEAEARLEQVSSDYQWLQVQAQAIKSARGTQGGELIRLSFDERLKRLERELNELKVVYKIKQFSEEDGKETIELDIKEIKGKTLLQWINKQVNFGYLLHSVSIKVVQQDRVTSLVRFEL